MYQNVRQMVQTIQTRRSHRHFTDELLSIEHASQVQRFIASLEPPFKHSVRISYHIVPNGFDIVYFKGPRQFIALEAENSIAEQAKLGFLGELIVLYCESLGIRTCWIGHYKKNQVHNIVYKDTERVGNRQLYCIIVIGYTPERTDLMDRFSKKRFSKKNRDIASFLDSDSIKLLSKELQFSLNLASKAPSAMNSQKWYYRIITDGSITKVEVGKIKGYQHFKWHYYDIDVGTAAAHCWLGLLLQGFVPTISLSSDKMDSSWLFSIRNN